VKRQDSLLRSRTPIVYRINRRRIRFKKLSRRVKETISRRRRSTPLTTIFKLQKRKRRRKNWLGNRPTSQRLGVMGAKLSYLGFTGSQIHHKTPGTTKI
jgi:hypothetical protein